MKDPQLIRSSFEENYEILDESEIIKLNEIWKNGDLNNVITGLFNECFGLILKDDGTDKNYFLFYCVGKIKLEAHLLHTSIDNPDRDSLTFFYANYLSLIYPSLDTIDNFNTFQTHLRSCCELMNYFTYDPYSIKEYNIDPNPIIIAPGRKGVIKIPIFNKEIFYKDFFGEREIVELNEGEKYIYLMLNKRNNHFKIGSSKTPFYREKTLQSEEPEIVLITYWKGQVVIEKKLHKLFETKRQRGEWFNLTLKDLQIIREQMSSYI